MTPRFVHGMVIGAFVGVVVVMVLGTVLPVSALTLSSVRDCDSNAVISCGALSTQELQKGYSKTGVKAIYDYFGIHSEDIKDIDKYVSAGRVYKNGDVMIGEKLVATKALTAGRENIKGSTKVSSGGATFYTRAPSVSFRVDSIAAFVVMKDGKFKFAILGSCANPIEANAVVPIPKPVPPPEVPPEKIPEKPPEVVALVATESTQTPESTPIQAVIPDTEVATLTVTGPGEVGLIFLLAIVGGYLYHVTHRHIRHKRRMRQAG